MDEILKTIIRKRMLDREEQLKEYTMQGFHILNIELGRDWNRVVALAPPDYRRTVRLVIA